MKYVLLICGSAEDQETWETMPTEIIKQAYARVNTWFGEHGSKITGGNQLRSPATATTVRFSQNTSPLVTDGPFIEGNEVIGGYAEIEVANLDEALAMVKTWPGGSTVEIRPVLVR